MRKLRNRCLLVGLATGLVVAASAPAHPPAPVDDRGRQITGRLHAWMHQAKVPLVRGRVRIRREACPGHPELAGCVFTLRARTFYMKPGVPDPRRLLYHELGHVFDFRVLNNRDRRRFKRILGIHSRGWMLGGLPPSEWFADGYAACAIRGRIHRRARPTEYGYAPTRRQHARVCRLIRAAVAPRSPGPRTPKDPPPVGEVAPPPAEETRPSDGQGEGEGEEPSCNLVDQLLTGCTPGSPPPPPVP
jgi:hypothetical protein